MDEFVAVVNPAAGRGRALEVAHRVAAALPAGWVRVVASRHRDHACELALRACADGAAVLAVGGDGHAGCVAGAVVEAGGVLGLVPAGRGNDFARQLGVPADVAGIAAVLRAGATRAVDVLDCRHGGASRIVLGSVFAGVDSVATEIVDARPPVPGPLLYPYAAVRALLAFRPAGYRVLLDGEEWDARGFTVVVANSGFYGGGMHIVPTAEVDDGLLDVLLLRDSSRWRLIASLREVYAGTHLRRPDVEVRRGRRVALSTDPPVPVGADGERLGPGPVEVSVRPGALRVLVPSRD